MRVKASSGCCSFWSVIACAGQGDSAPQRHRAAQQVVKHPGGQAGGFTADGAYQ